MPSWDLEHAASIAFICAIADYFARHPERLPVMAELAEGARLGADKAAEAAIRACAGG